MLHKLLALISAIALFQSCASTTVVPTDTLDLNHPENIQKGWVKDGEAPFTFTKGDLAEKVLAEWSGGTYIQPPKTCRNFSDVSDDNPIRNCEWTFVIERGWITPQSPTTVGKAETVRKAEFSKAVCTAFEICLSGAEPIESVKAALAKSNAKTEAQDHFNQITPADPISLRESWEIIKALRFPTMKHVLVRIIGGKFENSTPEKTLAWLKKSGYEFSERDMNSPVSIKSIDAFVDDLTGTTSIRLSTQLTGAGEDKAKRPQIRPDGERNTCTFAIMEDLIQKLKESKLKESLPPYP